MSPQGWSLFRGHIRTPPNSMIDFRCFDNTSFPITAAMLASRTNFHGSPYGPEVPLEEMTFSQSSLASSSPSSQAASRPPGPLRTGRESFPSPSSSPSNASVKETRFRNGKTLTMYPVMALWMK